MKDGRFEGAEGSVFYRAWEPEGTPRRIVLLVHGYAEHSGRYAHVAEALVAHGAAVLAEDHIGHGHSDGERALLTDFTHVVDDLETLLGIALAAYGDLPVVLVGHSMGGLLSTLLAERLGKRVAGLVLCGAVIGDWTWARDVLREPAMPDPPTDWSGMSRDPRTVHEYSTDPLVYRDRYKRPLLEAEVVALDQLNAGIDRITMPVLFLHGEADPFVAYGTSLAAAKRFPTHDLTIRVYAGARHEVLNEIDRAEPIGEIVAFCDRVAAGAPKT